jgi:hypothetical protein
MPLYRTRPEFVEAILLLPETAEQIARWSGGTVSWNRDGTPIVSIPTQLGTLVVLDHMYVIKDMKNQWNAMKITDFTGKYELI